MTILEFAEQLVKQLNGDIDRHTNAGALASWADPIYLKNNQNWVRLYRKVWAVKFKRAHTRKATVITSYPSFWIEIKVNDKENWNRYPFKIYVLFERESPRKLDAAKRLAQVVQEVLDRNEGWVSRPDERERLQSFVNGKKRVELYGKFLEMSDSDGGAKAYVEEAIIPLDNALRALGSSF
jgi:hypothetical protein